MLCTIFNTLAQTKSLLLRLSLIEKHNIYNICKFQKYFCQKKMEMIQQQLAISLEQTPLPEQINFEEQAIIEQVLRLSLDASNSKTFSKANGLPNRYVKLIKTMQMGRSKQQCTICIEGFCQQQSIKRFPCGHIFHSRCAKEWLKVNKRCPLCRLDLQKHFQLLEQTTFNKMGNS